MFTGIVTAVGNIEEVMPLTLSTSHDPANAAGVRLTIEAARLALNDVAIGDSIAVQGACMTVIGKQNDRFMIEVSSESLSKTTGLDQPGEVNLEKALRLNDLLGGHLVAGHVDGLGEVTHFAPVGESYELRVLAPPRIGRYLAYKGSVTIDGVSLTVNRVSDLPHGCEFSVNLIPHTLEVTTLKALQIGSQVNLEVDLIARYVERMLSLNSVLRQAA
jgi:riboflavin synthase